MLGAGDVQFLQAPQSGQFLQPRVGDVSAGEAQRMQALQSSQIFQARVPYLGEAEVQLLQALQAGQILKPRVGNLRFTKDQRLQVLQVGQFLQAGVRDLRAPEVQLVQVLQTGQFLQSGIRNVRIGQVQTKCRCRRRQLGQDARGPHVEAEGGNFALLAVRFFTERPAPFGVVRHPTGTGTGFLPGGNKIGRQFPHLIRLAAGLHGMVIHGTQARNDYPYQNVTNTAHELLLCRVEPGVETPGYRRWSLARPEEIVSCTRLFQSEIALDLAPAAVDVIRGIACRVVLNVQELDDKRRSLHTIGVSLA